jgi:hypothetical protein
MPSPLAHAAMGYVLYRATKKPDDSGRIGPLPQLLILTVGISILPDLDFLAGIIFGDLYAYHNQVSHSLVVGTGFSLLAAGAIWLATRRTFGRWFLILALSYNLHIVMDFFTYKTRGIMLFWPFTEARYEGAVKLFYGVRWSEGLWTPSHLVTLATELGVVFLLVLFSSLLFKPRQSRPSRKGDISIVEEGGR